MIMICFLLSNNSDPSEMTQEHDFEACANDFPKGKYDVILVDLPWWYSVGTKTYTGTSKYPKMSIQQMKDLDVASIAGEDCALLLWTTGSYLQRAFSVIDAWGFTYKTMFLVWCKTYKSGKPVVGLGHYTRSCCEYLLLAVKGRPIKFRQSRSVGQLIEENNDEHFLVSVPTGHSKKPELSFEAIEQFFGKETKKVELFARKIRGNWSSWGLELAMDSNGNCIYFHEPQ